MQHQTRVGRGLAVSLVAIFLVAGGALAADRLNGNSATTARPAITTPEVTPEPAETPDAVETPDPAETPDVAETPDPAETPDVAETPDPAETPDVAETPDPAETPDAVETPEPRETPDTKETSGSESQNPSGGGDAGDSSGD
jgi:outer membrane biosynthesis protein TonB